MSEESTSGRSHSEDLSSNNYRLEEVLKTCANIQSMESLTVNDYNDVYIATPAEEGEKMISSSTRYSFSGFISTHSSCGSDDLLTDIVLEDDNRISLAYENLCTIPRRLADKFAAQTKFLDLSYNKFQNLQFLAFFEELDTLILDRNSNLDVNTFPYLANLKILWINNCDICNITDWIHRIERQCPSLEQLSCMGNPGIQTVFKGQGKSTSASYFREYILQVLPNLKFLDGVSLSKPVANSSCTSMTGQGPESTSTSDRQICDRPLASPTLSFREFFRLKPLKKAQSKAGCHHENGSSTN
ncbi:GH19551 [Drosophila grimshawi]|uniref:GH19551 n=1 Tax=Drosophila grimshawi TaxID=7222 RepID=B4JHD4_DROGR|nr:GH19551 [Drosophila grimshawi]